MKEATGELSMTAIVVVIIGVIAVAAPPIVRSVVTSAGRSAKCMAAYNCTARSDGKYDCFYTEDGGTNTGDTEGTKIICSADEIGLEDSTK